ncbi:MAG TPA: DUF2264 domain-containing protein [Rectinemataceae bacterium]|nr:DUF2264 domain-containing protein [Rectinemataceae bacterium]
MKRWALPVAENPLKDKADLIRSLDELMEPLLGRFIRGDAGLHVGNSAAHYDEAAAALEGESRLLWGLGPFAADLETSDGPDLPENRRGAVGPSGASSAAAIRKILRGIELGSDPSSPHFWGIGGDRDQRYVEMAAMALSLLIAPKIFWDPLSKAGKENFAAWLATINDVELPPTNWEFFRVLVNVALKHLCQPFSGDRLKKGLEAIDALYREDGWYIDETNYDLYNPFAFHFYGLIYARFEGGDDPRRAGLFRERARLFAAQYLPWFAADGSCVPFGRSLCYRFAAAAFFSACAFADEEILPWGVLKGIVLRNLRWWFSKPIFDHEGLLTIGYGYPNLIMAEQYNSPGSPYWALKTYLVLALPDSHPFWTAAEESLPRAREVSHNALPHLLVCAFEGPAGKHRYLLNAGQYPCWESVHAAAKYAKFAYSNQFGFCVSHGSFDLSKTGCDSSLVLSEGDGYWRERRQSGDRFSCERYVFSTWKPWPDVTVKTWLIPVGLWHVRVHAVDANRELESVEGGFSLPDDDGFCGPVKPEISRPSQGALAASFPWAFGGITDLCGRRAAELHKPEPNLNILHPKVLIPILRGRIALGRNLLACAALAGEPAGGHAWETAWNDPPRFFLDRQAGTAIIEADGLRIAIKADDFGGLR